MQKDSRFVSRYRLVMSRTKESLDDDSYQGIALAIPHCLICPVSYQGIALAIPHGFKSDAPLGAAHFLSKMFRLGGNASLRLSHYRFKNEHSSVPLIAIHSSNISVGSPA